MRVFVTRATGYVGSVVAEHLLARGHAVVGLARSPASEARLRRAGIAVIQGSLRSEEALAAAARETDGTIHLAANFGPDFVADDVRASDVLMQALADSGKPLIYTSMVTVLGDTGDRVLDETAPLPAAGPLAWRGQRELAVRSSAARGVRSIVVRPAEVYGRAGGAAITRLLTGGRARGVVPYVGDGQNRRSTVHVDDLAALYVLALEHSAGGEVYNAASAEAPSFRAIAEAVADLVGHGTKAVSIPLPEARQQMAPASFLADILTWNAVVSATKARDVLDWYPSRPPLLAELAAGSYPM